MFSLPSRSAVSASVFRTQDAGFFMLHDCTSLGCQLWDSRTVVIDVAAIAAAKPEILSAEDATTVLCSDGTLRVCAADFSLALDSGRAITFADLCSVSDAYWTEWSECANNARS